MRILRMSPRVTRVVVSGIAWLWIAMPAFADETAHAGGEAAEHASAPNILNVDPGLMIWTIVTFVLLLLVLSRFGWKPLIAGLETRQASIRSTIADADRVKREADEVLARHQQMLDTAKGEAQEIIEEGKSDAVKLQHEMTAEARREGEEIKARALREVELATDQARKDLWEETSRLSTALAEKILRRSLDSDDHRRLVEKMLDEFRTARAGD